MIRTPHLIIILTGSSGSCDKGLVNNCITVTIIRLTTTARVRFARKVIMGVPRRLAWFLLGRVVPFLLLQQLPLSACHLSQQT
jgi:hypothetical protein